MSDDLGKTDPVSGVRVLRAEIASLRQSVEVGFAALEKRLDDHQADAKQLQAKVHDLEIFRARVEERDDPKVIAEQVKRIDALEKWRWLMMGAGAAAGAAGGQLIEAVAKLTGGG